MKKRLYIIKGSYPEEASIKTPNNTNAKYILFSSFEDFEKQCNYLFALSKLDGYEIKMLFIPNSTRPLYFSYLYCKCSQYGWINLKDFTDLKFYEYDEENDKEIFEDLFLKYLESDHHLILQSLTDHSYAKKQSINFEYKSNFDMQVLGKQLLLYAKNDVLYNSANEEMLPLDYIAPHYLTEEMLITTIAKKYKIFDRIKFDKSILQTNNTNSHNTSTSTSNFKTAQNHEIKSKLILNAIYSIIFAIYRITNNYEDIKQIVRHLISLTDTTNSNLKEITQQYKNLGTHLKERYGANFNFAPMHFSEIEQIIKSPLSYNFFFHFNLLEPYGYRIYKFDFNNKLIHFVLST